MLAANPIFLNQTNLETPYLMNTQAVPRNLRPVSQTQKIAGEDRAFVRLAAAIVEAPEEVVLAALLANRSKSATVAPIGSN